jgi:hypothetical protein
MTALELLEQPHDKSDNINKVVTTVSELLISCSIQLVDGLLADLPQDVRFLRVYSI